MGSWTYRAVSLAMIVALAGTPAVAAACAALCMPEVGQSSSMAMADTTHHHATHGSMPAAEAQATRDESGAQGAGQHHALAQESQQARSGSRAAAIEAAAASARTCCSSTDAVLRASAAAVRAHTGALVATASAVATPVHAQMSLRSQSGDSPPFVPPCPTRDPVVLRI
ncbi:MAG: hypothetical protein ABR606_02000 [Vicinamibacterales bacterium]